jgi:hypothetical protein
VIQIKALRACRALKKLDCVRLSSDKKKFVAIVIKERLYLVA